MSFVTRLSAFTILMFASATTSVLSANEAFERWEKRIPGHHVAISYESTYELHRHCADFLGPLEERGVLGGFTPECEAHLDELYLDEIPPLMPFEATDHRITWRHVFDRPWAKRRLVLDALDNPACLMAPDQLASNRLTEDCRVDAIADYAVLKYQCASGYYRIRGRIEQGIELPWWYVFPLERFLDNESYWRKRSGIERAYFRYAWIAAKCAGLANDVLPSLRRFEITPDFGGEPESGEEGWWWAEQGYEAYLLMGVADRLFDNLTQTKYGYRTETLSVWQRVQPVMAELIQVKRFSSTTNATGEKTARLKHFIAAQTWIKKRRTNVSEDWLREQIGEYSDEELTQAAEEARAMMNEQEVGTNWN